MNRAMFRLSLGIRQTKPIWLQDYAHGFSIFTLKQDDIISEGIAWFMSIDASLDFAKLLKDGFKKGLSHVVSVETATHGMEATIGGIQRCELKKYFDDPSYIVICREPEAFTDLTALEKLTYQEGLLGNDYDYGILPWFALMSLTGLQSIIKSLRKMIPIGHKKGARVCSSFEADGFYNTVPYHSIQLFEEWNVLGIHVHRLFLDFPYKQFKIGKERVWL